MSEASPSFKIALNQYLSFTGDPVATLAEMTAAQPGFIIGHTTIAALNVLGGVPGSHEAVQGPLNEAKAHLSGATKREKLHHDAASAWAKGEIEEAATFWEDALRDEPGDILSLRLAHDTHFFLGALQKLRDVPLSALDAYAADAPERGFVLGMAAFGLEETGDYAAAEKAGREAVERNKGDSWGIHAIAHVLEMQVRVADGIDWMHGLEPHWSAANGLAVHQWWHLCLYLLEEGQLDEVLAIYDQHIRPTPASIVLDLIDASALLWRLELAGVNVGQRWRELAQFWGAHADEHVLVFNDLHISLALNGAGDKQGADRLEASIEDYIRNETGTNAKISQTLGLPVIRALRAFQDGDHRQVISILRPLYTHLTPIGGSNAQRDLIIQTLGISAAISGDHELTAKIAKERRKLKTGSPFAWARYPELKAA